MSIEEITNVIVTHSDTLFDKVGLQLENQDKREDRELAYIHNVTLFDKRIFALEQDMPNRATKQT